MPKKPLQTHHLPSLGSSAPLVPPLYQSSVYTLPDLDSIDGIANGEPGFIYARDSHPNARHLAAELAQIERCAWGVVTGSGMAAISAILLATVQQGQRVVASNRLYGRTVQLLEQELGRFGVQTIFVDTCNLAETRVALASGGAKVLFVETMSNPLCRIVDIPALAKLAHDFGARLIVDNTFATPVLTKPIEMGADIVMESLTKLIAGHSDVTLGFLAGNEKDLLPQLNSTVSIWGLASNPFDCWLAQRGLSTLTLRMQAAQANAAGLADWLAEQSGVARVVYPGRAEHPDHELARDILDGGFGNMMCFELKGGRDAVNRFLRRAPGIPFSPSLGHTTTTLSHPGTTSHRYVNAAEKKRQGIGDGLIRLSVGVEDLAAIQATIRSGLDG